MNNICPNFDQSLDEVLSKYSLTNAKEFLDVKDLANGITNWEKIQRKYTKDELDENQSKYPSLELLVKAGTQLSLPLAIIQRDLSKKVQSNIIKSTEYRPFLVKQLADLLRDPKYVQEINSSEGERIATIDNNDVTVYIWCRALTPAGDNSQSGTWFNVSAFIQSIQTQVTQNGGAFTFSLSPVTCERSDGVGDLKSSEGGYATQGGWNISNVVGFETGDVRDDILSRSTVGDRFLFNTILQENDLVYIRFERLSLESELAVKGLSVDQRINPNHVHKQIWDMIGLIDDVTLSVTPNSASINVVGRDLMKILIDDGSYFFPEQFAQQIFTDENSLLTKRNRYELEAQALSAANHTFKSIETILKFIFNKFSNLGLVSNAAFIGYGTDAITDKYQLKSSKLQKKTKEVIDKLNARFLKEPRQGVWRICEFIFDPQVAQRVLADNSISQDNGSIINSIKKVCQEPFVEFRTDTYGDKFYFFIRKPPFDAKGYRGLVYDNILVDSIKDGVNTNTQSKTDSRLVNSLKNEREIRDDGFADIAKPTSLSDLVIDIDSVDVLGEPQLSYHNEAYSWYRVIPRGLGIIDEATSFLLAPIVPFDEYAEVWGNKTYSIEYNYAPIEYLQDSQFKAEAQYAEAQTFYDLQFVIQSNQYLPFTRRGVIVLTGNRLIKSGLFVHYKPTNEVFYVDAVAHARGVENRGSGRQTILQVSRGMREPYIKGLSIKFPSGNKKVSYFDIIRTDIDNTASINNKEFLKNWKVDRDIFNFFVQRRQWVD